MAQREDRPDQDTARTDDDVTGKVPMDEEATDEFEDVDELEDDEEMSEEDSEE